MPNNFLEKAGNTLDTLLQKLCYILRHTCGTFSDLKLTLICFKQISRKFFETVSSLSSYNTMQDSCVLSPYTPSTDTHILGIAKFVFSFPCLMRPLKQ